MITSAIYAGRTYIQGFIILLISCLAFSQDFNFRSDSATASNSESSASDLIYNHTSNTSGVSQNLTQSQSYNADESEDILIISLADSTNTNADDSINNELLIIENNGEDLNYSPSLVTINLSSDITESLTTNVSYQPIKRIWKIEEVNSTTPTVKIQIPQESIENRSSTGRYFMFISNSDVFDSTSEFVAMTLDENNYLNTTHNFDSTTYITFGFADQVTEKRSIRFDGSEDYIDMGNTLDLNPNGFTISAWIKRDINSTDEVSVLSKRDAAYTQGYDLALTNDNKVKVSWVNNGYQSHLSNTSIPNNEWHHLAITYSGSRVAIYIDGVLDSSAAQLAPLPSDAAFHIAAAGQEQIIQHFKGHIDEVRIWNTDLTQDQLRFIMNQEIDKHSSFVTGKELPTSITKNTIQTVSWSDLAGYYQMSEFAYKNTIDASGNGNDGELKNITSVDLETAPLPYKSNADGDWSNNTSWTNGTVQYIPGSKSIVNPNMTIDWNIVRTSHNLTMTNESLPTTKNENRTVLGLFVDSNELTIKGETETQKGNGLTITHYLNLGGTIDLEGESQLIQTLDSDLDVAYNGKIERDQQGTIDKFTYNYWSSPVTKLNASVSSFKVSDVVKDGTIASEPLPINFSSSGYDGAQTHPIKIADYWIWKYANQPVQNYSSWQHIRRTGLLTPGEGFTMKGPGIVTNNEEQNYVFTGKPNNGNINLTVAPNNEYLVGNPYPSAIDADIFIRDNIVASQDDNTSPLISGTLYFWNHHSGGSHLLLDYKGGYATYNYSGSVAAAIKENESQNFMSNPVLSEKPGRFIPVGQGFFVVGEQGGTINFNNGQRVFKKEGSGSEFLRNSNASVSKNNTETETIDDRMKFRIGFNSINTINRQLLLTIDENTSPDIDWAYDGKLNETQIDDMFWIINDEAYIIQASNEAETSTVYPLGIRTDSDGLNTITLDALENVPNDINVYIHDTELELYHDLRQSNYEIFLNAGEYLDRFEITFSTMTDSLGLDDEEKDSIAILYSNDVERLILINPNQIEVKSIVLFNMLGQSVATYNNNLQSDHTEYDVNNLKAGAYIVKLLTANDSVMTKKIIIE